MRRRQQGLRCSHWMAVGMVALSVASCSLSVSSNGGSKKRKAKAAQLATQKAQPTAERAKQVTGAIVAEGVINCFAPGLRKPPSKKHPQGKPVHCETSAILDRDGHVMVASDKPIPVDGKSSVFAVVEKDGKLATEPSVFFTQPGFLSARKYEDFAPLVDGKAAFLTTGFDRVKKKKAKWDVYNTLFFFTYADLDAGKAPQVVASDGAQPATSRPLRGRLSRALATPAFADGVPYFKTEGLVVLPADKPNRGRLVFGVREKGESYKTFDYAITLVEVGFAMADGRVLLDDKAEVILDVPPAGHVPQTLGLSSLAYDTKRQRLYLLTSYETEETDEGLGAYVWSMSLDDLAKKRHPTLVAGKDGKPLRFAHKAEGVSVREDGDLWVIHDDDRVVGQVDAAHVTDATKQFTRQAHQASWSLVDIVD